MRDARESQRDGERDKEWKKSQGDEKKEAENVH